MNLDSEFGKIKDISALMSDNYMTDAELLDFYTREFKSSDLHQVEVKGYDEIQEVSYLSWWPHFQNEPNLNQIQKDSIFGGQFLTKIGQEELFRVLDTCQDQVLLLQAS